MKKVFNSIIVPIILAALILAGCGSAPKSGGGGLNVLASTTILADIARHVAGDRAEVSSILPIGADPHAYQAAPSDVAKIAASQVLIVNGLEYERFIQPLIENAGGERLVVSASDGLTPDRMTEAGSSVSDPHMWLDPTRVIRYVENIRDGLIQADPAGADIYKANADAYVAQLNDLDSWITEQVSTIPPAKRLLVTNHEALNYFAERYGFKIVGAIVPSLSTDAGASAQQMAALVDQIKASGAPAIFLDAVENPSLANQIAAETDAVVVTDLYLETLTAGAPAATYIDMMKHNVSRIVEVLK